MLKNIDFKKLSSLNILVVNKHNLDYVTVDSVSEYVKYFGVDDNYNLVIDYFNSNTDTLVIVGSCYSINIFRGA